MSGNFRNLNVQDVIERFIMGNLPVVSSRYSSASVFDDGVEVPHQIMQAAAHKMNLTSPAKGERWSAPIQACSSIT